MTREQLDAIKARVEIRGKYRCFDRAINTMLLNTDVPALIAEVERLREAFLLIQNSDTWLIEPSPMMHTIEEAYHACIDIADKALADALEVDHIAKT